jgi:hypothetical protein
MFILRKFQSTGFSHREFVRNALWLQSKTGTEFFSAAMEGKIHWWDTKKMNEPADKLILDLEKKERSSHAIGITKLVYDSSIVRQLILLFIGLLGIKNLV